MLQVILLCIFLQSALTKNISNENDATDKPQQELNNDLELAPHHNLTTLKIEKSIHDDNSSDENINILLNTRRNNVLKWFKHLLVPSSTTTTKPPNDKNIEQIARQSSQSITTILSKLTEVMDDLNKNLKKTEQEKYLTLRVPIQNARIDRNKRNVK